MYEALFSRGIRLIFLKEPHINTDTYKKALESGIPSTGTSVDYILDGVNKLSSGSRQRADPACI